MWVFCGGLASSGLAGHTTEGWEEWLAALIPAALPATSVPQDKIIEVVPRLDTQVCMVFDNTGGDFGLGEDALPDVRGWAYGGRQQLNGQPVELWQFSAR